ncbi:hypothetical protein [Botrimarina sp.]|uniref:hypothetical protein n=1 Tax=Botrimarina sp. TaxID=2795802 RepID=UPI0032EEA985
MSEPIRVVCDGCGKTIRAPAHYLGQTAPCPGCSTPVRIERQFRALGRGGDILPEPEPPPATSPLDTKPCPYCAETIKTAAKKCRFCGELLDHGLRLDRLEARGGRGVSGSGLAMVLSFVVPGLGQVYNGKVLVGILWLLLVVIGYSAFVLPGLLLHICCVIHAGGGSVVSAVKNL